MVLNPGTCYSLSASGRWRVGSNTCCADGYESTKILRLLELTRRVRQANWFTLIGAVDSAKNKPFVIGCGIIYRPVISGELLCYANDTWIAYCNNHGTVTLDIYILHGEVRPHIDHLNIHARASVLRVNPGVVV